jgi:hypothetical protein
MTHPLIHYERQGNGIRLRLLSVTNHELREVLTGLWARLDADDRADHINALLHYAPMLNEPAKYPDRFLSDVAKAISASPDDDAVVIDLATIGDDR